MVQTIMITFLLVSIETGAHKHTFRLFVFFFYIFIALEFKNVNKYYYLILFCFVITTFVVCLKLFCLALCEERPKIIQEVSGTIERNSGENATFYCKVDNPKGYTVSWVKLNRDNPSDQTVLTYDENLVLKDRLNVSVTPARDTYTLEVRRVSFFIIIVVRLLSAKLYVN